MKHRYHIHITSEDTKAPRGFKLTSVILEKRKIIQKHNMFTRTYIGTDNVKNDINAIVDEFKNKFSNIQRFKIELLDEPNYLDFYTNKNYREIHIKCRIESSKFNKVKSILKSNEDRFGFSLSNNPKEVTEKFITQFVNIRYMNKSFSDANSNFSEIMNFLNFDDIKIIEVKEEISVYDTNFDLDKWWTE